MKKIGLIRIICLIYVVLMVWYISGCVQETNTTETTKDICLKYTRDKCEALEKRINRLEEAIRHPRKCKICNGVILEAFYLTNRWGDELEIERLTDTSMGGMTVWIQCSEKNNRRITENGWLICNVCANRGLGWLAIKWCELKK